MTSRLTSRDQQRLQQARAAAIEHSAVEAIRQYAGLTKKYPDHPGILAELAQCHAGAKDFERANLLLQQLIDRHHTSARIMVIVGRTYDTMHFYDQALVAYRLALKHQLPAADEIQARTSIAATCERKNELLEAQIQIDYLMTHAADAPATLLLAGILASRNDDWEAAEAQLRRAGQSDLPPLLKVRAGHELARVLEKQNRFDEAIETVSIVKQIERPGKESALAISRQVARLTERMIALIGPHHFKEWDSSAREEAGARSDQRQIGLITGHPRSGTTLLEQMLDSHSAINSADESSALLHSLVTPLWGGLDPLPTSDRLLLKSIDPAVIDHGRREYTKQLEQRTKVKPVGDLKREHWLFDKNPEAIVMLPVLQRVLPAARVIVVLRDPRDVCLSCFMQFLPMNPVSCNFDSLANVAAKYARTMMLWLKIRSWLKLKWYEIKYEELVNDPVEQMRRVFDFLDLNVDEQSLKSTQLFSERAKGKEIRSPSYQAVARPLSSDSIGRWRNYEKCYGPALQVLQPFIQKFNY